MIGVMEQNHFGKSQEKENRNVALSNALDIKNNVLLETFSFVDYVE